MGQNQTYIFEFGEYRLDPSERRLLRGAKVIPLTPKAFETLFILVENSGHMVEKNRLMELLWADTFVEEGNLADNVSKIRQALGDSRKEQKFIETVSGRGYRFVAEVRRIERETVRAEMAMSDPASSAEGLSAKVNPPVESSSFHDPISEAPPPILRQERNSLAAPHVVASEESGAESKISNDKLQTEQQPESGNLKSEPYNPQKSTVSIDRRWLAALSVLSILALVATGFFLWRGNGKPTGSPIKTIAVLPFKPLAANSRDESLELGMSDSLITGLGSIRQITVRPISAVRRYTDLEQDAAAAGRELQVESVLEGNIQRDGDQIRITARLVRVEDGKTLWTETFDENFTNIFAVQDSISQKIVGALALQLSGEERNQLAKKYTANTEAYQLYLKGRFFWSKLTLDGLQKSLGFYSQAIEVDPSYALAYAGLADSYNLLGSYGFWSLKESHPKARAAAEKALAIDSELPEAHTSLAAVIDDYFWDWPAAEKHYKQAIYLNPNYPLARSWYSQHLARMGRLDESIEEAKQAQMLNPLSPSANAHVGLALYRARRYDEATAELQKALEFDPDALDAHIFLGFVYVQRGRSGEAIAEFQNVAKLSGRNPSLLALLGYAYATAGKRDEAYAILKELNESKLPASPFETAMIYIGLGEREQAFTWLEKAYSERSWQLGFLKVEPIFDPLRRDKRFTDLMRSVNLTPQ